MLEKMIDCQLKHLSLETSVKAESLSLAKILFHNMTKNHQQKVTFFTKEMFRSSRNTAF